MPGDKTENTGQGEVTGDGCWRGVIKVIWSMLDLRCQCHTEVEVPVESKTWACDAELSRMTEGIWESPT